MKKGKFKGAILACSLLAFGAIITTTTFGLTSCGQKDDDNKDDTVDPNMYDKVTAFAITNTQEFDATKEGYSWYPGDTDKEVKFEFTGQEVNLLKAFQNKLLTSESSNPEVASVINNYISPNKGGKATITFTFKAGSKILTQTLDVTVLEPAVQPETKVATIKELKAINFEEWSAARPQQDYRVTGTVVDWYRDEAPSKYGNFNIKDDEGNTILVYGATTSKSALTFNINGTWTFNNPKDFVDKDGNGPCKIGDKVTLHVVLTAYKNNIQLNAVIENVEEGKDDAGGDTGGDTQGSVEEALKKATPISIADLAAKTAIEDTKFYTVTGIVNEAKASDQYGNITLVDRTTGASVTSYGTAKDATCWSIDENSKIKFTNPKDFGTECLGKKFNVGDEVKFNVMLGDKYGDGKQMGINLQFVEKVNDASKYKYGVEFDGESKKYFEDLTKTEFAFGEEITLTPKTSAIPEGKALSIELNGNRVGLNSDGKLVFKAEVKNVIKVTLADASSVADVVITAESLGLGSGYTEYDESNGFLDISGLKFDYSWLMNNGKGKIQINKKTVKNVGDFGGSLWVAAPAEKEIEKIVFNGSTDGWDKPAAGAILYTTFGVESADHSINTIKTEAEIPETIKYVKTQFTASEKTFTVTSNVEGAKTFAISHLAASGATYLDSIEVFYK